MILSRQSRRDAKAFSLVEVTIAIAIVAVASISLVSALNQSLTMRNETTVREDGTRFESFVRASLKDMSFDSLYQFLEKKEEGVVFYAYTYMGHPRDRRVEDHSPVPDYGNDSVKVQGFRRSNDPLFAADLEYRVDEAFKIRLTEFPYDPDDKTFVLAEDVDDYEGAALPVFVEVFQDPLPGEKPDEWLIYRRQLSFPVLIPRN